MTRKERREWERWERKEFMRSILESEKRDKKMIDEMMEKVEAARAFQEEQIRRGIEPETITVSSDWELF